MSSNLHLKQEFYDVLSENHSILEWLNQETISGIWVVNETFPENLWMNLAFLKNLGYDDDETSEVEVISLLSNTIKTHIINFVKNSSNEIFEFEDILIFEKKSGIKIGFKANGKKIISAERSALYLIKLREVQDWRIDNGSLESRMETNRNLINIYHETNELAKVGGWEVDLIKNKLSWTKVTMDIHEVGQDYEPVLSEGINFYKPGWSRDTITQLFNDAVEKGIPFDIKLKLITAKKNEIWVRSLGKPVFKDGKCIRVYGAFQNIDTEKRIEEKYKSTREQFEMIFNNSSVGNVLIGSSGELLQVNPATFKIFGYDEKDRKEVMKMSFKDLIHKDFLINAVSYRNRLIAGEINNYQLESKFHKKDGTIIWCRTNSSIIRSSEPDKDLIITQVEDITEKKELEFKARENANRFKAAFEYSPIGMGVVSLEGEWQMVNQNLASIFGYTKEEFINKTSRELTHEDDLKKDSSNLRSLLNREIDTYSVEKRFIHKNGKTIFGILNVSTIVDDDGAPRYLIGQVNDITKRILFEQALQRSLNDLQSLMDATTHVSIIETDLHGIVQKFNKGAENLLGYSEEEVKFTFNVKNLHEAKEIEDRGKELSAENGKDIQGFEVFIYHAKQGFYDSNEWTYIRKDGSKFTVQLVVTAITNQTGEITGFLGVATDISQLKQMETNLIKAKKKAEAASRSKSEFLANMSHEIRTPLNGIIGFTDLLMRTELENSQQKYMHTIYNSANSLMDIINDVLDFSKIEAGKLELSEERLDLIELCTQTIDIIKHQAHKKGLEVLVNISPSLRRYVYADAVRLRQILTNLLGNSVKFTQEGEIELNVSSQAISEKEDELLFNFSIRDTGIGIAPQNLKKIFHAFDQEDASTTRKYGGSGLGLSISNKLLNLMDSKLELKSTLNEGSIFSFKVKLKTDKELNYIAKSSRNIKNVLVVDDNTNNRTILTEMLAANHINTQECANGVEALNLLNQKNSNFDLAIIDYNMPYMNGLSVIEQIRNNLKKSSDELPIILLHSSTEDQEILKGCKDLAVRFNLTKPIQIHTLFKMIDSIEQPGEIKPIENSSTSKTIDLTKVHDILIVEDNPVNRFLANSIIKKILPNSNLIQAENGLEAVEKYKNNKLDLIFMDIQMPIMSGLEATEEIRKIEKENSYTPIVALTARAVKNEKNRCIKSGMDDYLAKPVILEDIRIILEKFLLSSKEKEIKK
ncbi:PAS domain S-box protein [Christiangramia sp.]|uniref:PAS domain-containing hybrid sensor histidine kinase/response regulator n=1 Tax=Christiangramia sp. TaxID=1931228 RepID=UPI002631D26B|nr:PAS domain S-box protein [Christiangramia sp.]